MDDHPVQDRSVLVAEDEYMIAGILEQELAEAGAHVIGPTPTMERTLDAIDLSKRIDAAILDVSLHDEMIFPAAERLQARGVPFVFTSGYDQSVIPARFEQVVRCEKPVTPDKLIRALSDVVSRSFNAR